MDSRTLAAGAGSFALAALAVFAVVGLGVGLLAAARWRRAA